MRLICFCPPDFRGLERGRRRRGVEALAVMVEAAEEVGGEGRVDSRKPPGLSDISQEGII